MKIGIILLIVNAFILILDLIVFLKYKRTKKELMEHLASISQEPEIFLDFFAK